MQETIRRIRHDLSGVASAVYLLRDGLVAGEVVSEDSQTLANLSADRMEKLFAIMDDLLEKDLESL